MRTFRLKRNAWGMNAGTVVHERTGDWGTSSADERATGKPYISVAPTGSDLSFSVAVEDLEEIGPATGLFDTGPTSP